MRKGDVKILIRNLRKIEENKTENEALDLGAVSGSTLVACDENGTPLINDDGTKVCNCLEPNPSMFPDSKYYCLECWGEYYR